VKVARTIKKIHFDFSVNNNKIYGILHKIRTCSRRS